jgi:hypothetical protein
MADKKISALTGAATPLAGTEVLPIVQSGSTVKVAVNDLTAGKTVNGSNFIASSSFGAGGTTPTAGWNTAVFQTQNASFNSNNGQDLRLYQNIYYDGSNYRYITANPGGFMLQYQNETEWFRSTDGSPAAGGVANATSVVKFTTTGNVNVSNGNLVLGTAAKGIDFSANTHAAGMTSELLGWYEEGNWTPVDGSGAGLSITKNEAYYTRIGRVVYFYLDVTYPATANGSLAYLAGLPFAPSKDGGGSIGFQNIVSATQLFANVSQSLSGVRILDNTGTTLVNLTLSGKRFQIAGQYIV